MLRGLKLLMIRMKMKSLRRQVSEEDLRKTRETKTMMMKMLMRMRKILTWKLMEYRRRLET